MELWQLRTFTVLAKNLHFTRAAEELHLSQPAVSHQIKSLEEEIGEPLFLRDKEGIWLTKTGETFYEHAKKILDIADELRLEIKENKDILTGKFKFGGVSRGLNNPFLTFYERFKKDHPGLELLFQGEYKLEDVVIKVRNKEIDVGLVSHGLDLSRLSVLPYGIYDLLLVVGKEHHLAGKKKVTIDDLSDEDWVMFESTNRLTISTRELFEKLDFTPKSVYQTNDGSLIRAMVARSEKIAFLPEWGVFEDLRDKKIRPLKVEGFEHKIQVNLIWRPEQKSKLIPVLITYILENVVEGIRPVN